MSDSRTFGVTPYRAARATPTRGGHAATDPFDLVAEETTLSDRAQIERYLPDILGRALARAWIDPGFRTRFLCDPKATLAAYRLHLPGNILIDVECEGQSRPLVVVSEQFGGQFGGRTRRILYLQLVMVAGR